MAWLPNTKGTKHSYVNYSSSHSSKSYEAKTAQVIQFRGMPTTDYEHSSPRKVDHPLMPLDFVRDRPEITDGLSPKFRDAVHIQEKGSPTKDFYKGNNPPMRYHDFGKYNHFDTISDDDDDDDDYECDDGVCRVKNTKLGARPNSFNDEGYDRNFEKYNRNSYDHSEPRKHTYYDKSYDDLDLEKDKRKSYITPNDTTDHYTLPSSNQTRRGTYYEPSYDDHTNEKEKGKSNGAYKIPTYSYNVPSSNQPKKDTYYDQAPPAYYNDKCKGGDYTTPYTVPATVIPKNDNRPMLTNPPPIKTRTDSWGKDTEYYNENGKNSPKYNSPRKDQGYDSSNNRPMMLNPTAIKTRNNMGRDEEYYSENGKNSPKYNSPLGKDHQGYGETIDSTAEARRRYGKVGPPRGTVYVAEDYTTGVIDSREAARRYKGVLLTN